MRRRVGYRRLMAIPSALTAIETHCPACGNDGVSAWDHPSGFSIDDYLSALRMRCPDCGASGRMATVLEGAPKDPELAAMWHEMQDMLAATPREGAVTPRRAASGPGRNAGSV